MNQLWNDGNHVWLRSRKHRGYLHADEDGVGVSVHGDRKSLNAAWVVHGDGGMYLRLHSAAYGHYLAATPTLAPRGHRGFRVEQRNYDQLQLEAIVWHVSEAGSRNAFLLRNIGSGGYLRANGKILRWNNAVSVDDLENRSTMMHWIVERIPPRARIPSLAAPLREGLPGDLSVILRLRAAASNLAIRFVRASDDGHYPEEGEQGWRSLPFRSRSVYHLRDLLASRLRVTAFNLIMCVRAGRYGRLTPLVENLPHYRGGATIEIVVVTRRTRAADMLRYPDVNARYPKIGASQCAPSDASLPRR